ncbi:MAG: AmmeMemoRadiSam system radical SAM enzyme [bacterium]|nr:AmmeMemoRadiSam system radical SAM enzyme [bacterium]
MKKEALYYKKNEDGSVQCLLCPHNCRINNSKAGVCRIRKNTDGTLYTLNYGEVTSIALDPIEKKPLYHFYPGTVVLSAGTFGCNFKCEFCQNWEISQGTPPSQFITPENLVETAIREDSFAIAYTYSEPMVWFEYVLESAKLAREKGLKNILVTNGYINQEPLMELIPVIDAMNIDLKGIKNEFYKEHPRGSIDPVLETIKTSFKKGVHVEVTNLIIPGDNDTKEELEELVDFIVSVSKDIPVHFSRYFPHYKMDKDPTPESTMFMAKEIGDKKLSYVYLGNIWSDHGSDTLCPKCGNISISRKGYMIDTKNLNKGICKKCGFKLNIIT